MNLVHDVLDKQVLDRNRCNVGRVDGVALELRDGLPPRVAYVELGGEAAMRRLGDVLARFARWLRRVVKPAAGPTRVPWESVTVIGKEIQIDAEAEATPALAVELWLRDNVVRRVPWS